MPRMNTCSTNEGTITTAEKWRTRTCESSKVRATKTSQGWTLMKNQMSLCLRRPRLLGALTFLSNQGPEVCDWLLFRDKRLPS